MAQRLNQNQPQVPKLNREQRRALKQKLPTMRVGAADIADDVHKGVETIFTELRKENPKAPLDFPALLLALRAYSGWLLKIGSLKGEPDDILMKIIAKAVNDARQEAEDKRIVLV